MGALSIDPGLTATLNRHPSDTARYVGQVILPQLEVRRLLDYGCGLGRDVRHYRSLGYAADGLDPHHRPRTPRRRYDLITCVAVLNVLPTAAERLEVIRAVRSLLTEHGVAIVTVRSRRWHTHDTRGSLELWRPYRDGHVLDFRDGVGLFQRGFSRDELDAWMDRGGMQRVGTFLPLGWAHVSGVFVPVG